MLRVLDCAAAEFISEMALVNIAYLLCAAMFEKSRGFGVLGYWSVLPNLIKLTPIVCR